MLRVFLLHNAEIEQAMVIIGETQHFLRPKLEISWAVNLVLVAAKRSAARNNSRLNCRASHHPFSALRCGERRRWQFNQYANSSAGTAKDNSHTWKWRFLVLLGWTLTLIWSLRPQGCVRASLFILCSLCAQVCMSAHISLSLSVHFTYAHGMWVFVALAQRRSAPIIHGALCVTIIEHLL